MTTLVPYLTFDGNCTEAMNFYHSCLGGALEIMKVGDTPIGEGKSDKEKAEVMHSNIKADGFMLFASDMLRGDKVEQGNAQTLCLNFDDMTVAETVFAKLSEGGTVDSALKKEFWGDIYGDLHDKYGFRWMFNVTEK